MCKAGSDGGVCPCCGNGVRATKEVHILCKEKWCRETRHHFLISFFLKGTHQNRSTRNRGAFPLSPCNCPHLYCIRSQKSGYNFGISTIAIKCTPSGDNVIAVTASGTAFGGGVRMIPSKQTISRNTAIQRKSARRACWCRCGSRVRCGCRSGNRSGCRSRVGRRCRSGCRCSVVVTAVCVSATSGGSAVTGITTVYSVAARGGNTAVLAGKLL